MIAGLGPVPHVNVLVDPELDEHADPSSSMLDTFPDGIPGDFNGGAGEQTPGVGEVSRVGLALAEKRQLLVIQRAQRDHDALP